MKNRLRLLLFIVLSLLCLTGMVQSQDSVVKHHYYPDQEWRTSTPEEQGLDSQILVKLFQALNTSLNRWG